MVGKDVTWGLNYPQVVHIVISGVGFGYNGGGGVYIETYRDNFKKNVLKTVWLGKLKLCLKHPQVGEIQVCSFQLS